MLRQLPGKIRLQTIILRLYIPQVPFSLFQLLFLLGKSGLLLGFVSVEFSLNALRILGRTDHDPAARLGVIPTPFGEEMLMMCLRNVLSNKNARNDPGGKDEL